jgi:hypothetical protein
MDKSVRGRKRVNHGIESGCKTLFTANLIVSGQNVNLNVELWRIGAEGLTLGCWYVGLVCNAGCKQNVPSEQL